MDYLHQAIFAEPTVAGYLGAGLFHLPLWMALGSWEWGGVKYFRDWIRRRAPKLYHDNIKVNHVGEKGVEICGMQDDPAGLWISNAFTFLHHGVGGLLMLIGILTDQQWVWRHGLMTQLWGMDIADYARVAWCLLFPPGPFPFSNSVRNPILIAFVIFHHTTSLIAGVPGSIYLDDSIEFRWMGCFLAGGPLLFVGWDLLARCVAPTFRRFHMMSGLFCLCMFFYQRIVMFFPMAWTLWGIVQASRMPGWAKGCLYLGGFNISCFNLLCQCMIVGGWLEKFWDKLAEDNVDIPNFEADLKSVDSIGGPTILTSSTSKQSQLKERR